MKWNEDPHEPRSFFLDTREAITLKDLRTLLSGRDFEAYQVYKDNILNDSLPRLLDGDDLGHQKVALLSTQPRQGRKVAQAMAICAVRRRPLADFSS